jgi:hypothetical protein
MVLLLALPFAAQAQLAVQLATERDTFLRYEAVPVQVSIRNYSGRTIQLEDQGDKPWLNFVVADENGRQVAATDAARNSETALIPPRQTVTRKIDLLPLFELRERGTYRVQATIASDGYSATSAPLKITVVNGREIWTQTVGLPRQDRDEYRTYSLVTRREQQYDILYVGVQDEARQLVYGMVPLGVYVALGEPSAVVDKAGSLHLLFRSGSRTFGYARVDPYAEVSDRAVYSEMLSQPRLVTDAAGRVSVQGGEKTWPRVEHVMSDKELQPPAPPPAPPKKRSWWPFGRRSSVTTTNPAPSASSTNAPVTNFGPRSDVGAN